MFSPAADLHALIEAVCPIYGIYIFDISNKSTWGVNFKEEATPSQRTAAQAIINSFDLTAWDAKQVRVDLRQAASKATAKAIPNWATWTQADWTTYYNANISATQINAIANLTDAKAMLNKMSIIIDRLAKMEIALRDHNFPDLPEG